MLQVPLANTLYLLGIHFFVSRPSLSGPWLEVLVFEANKTDTYHSWAPPATYIIVDPLWLYT